MHWIAKARQLLLGNLRLKITAAFEDQTRIRLKLTIRKIFSRQNRNNFEQFLQIFVLFWNKTNFEGFAIHFRGRKWLLWSNCLILKKMKRPEV